MAWHSVRHEMITLVYRGLLEQHMLFMSDLRPEMLDRHPFRNERTMDQHFRLSQHPSLMSIVLIWVCIVLLVSYSPRLVQSWLEATSHTQDRGFISRLCFKCLYGHAQWRHTGTQCSLYLSWLPKRSFFSKHLCWHQHPIFECPALTSGGSFKTHLPWSGQLNR